MPEADDYPKEDRQSETLDDKTPEHSKKEKHRQDQIRFRRHHSPWRLVNPSLMGRPEMPSRPTRTPDPASNPLIQRY
ncbi:hypothetical protein ACFQDN_09815 [Pseudomonas asuensis]